MVTENILTSKSKICTLLLKVIFPTALLGNCGEGKLAHSRDITINATKVESFYGFLARGVETVSAGFYHTCLLDDEIKCWGYNEYGQTEVPEGLKNPRSVSAGRNHTCAIHDDGVKCWGRNEYNQTEVPQGLKNPRSISAGRDHTCALFDIAVVCWGRDFGGLPYEAIRLKKPKSISAGSDHTCVIDDEGVKCWGNNDHGQIKVPEGLKNPRTVSAGLTHTCAIDDEGVKCWGAKFKINTQGPTDFGQTKVPEGLKNPRSVSAGGTHTCAIDDEGVKCWGAIPMLDYPAAYGQTKVPGGLKKPRSVSTGMYHTCAIDDEGINCWGHDKFSQTDVPTRVYKINSFTPWPRILSQYLNSDKFQFFHLIQETIFSKLPQESNIQSKAHQLLIHLMTRYIKEFPSDYFRRTVFPRWQKSLIILKEKTGVSSASDVPKTPETLVVAVKLLNAAFVAIKPMLSGPEQREVDEIILKINACLAGEMTQTSAQGLVKEIRKHQTLMNAIAASDVVHLTSVVVDDASRWIMEE